MDAESFQSRLMSQFVNGLGSLVVFTGHRLGLFAAMAKIGQPVMPKTLASEVGYSERYVQEWLECCATHGYVEFVGNNRYSLPVEHATAMTNKDSPFYTGAAACWLPSCASACTDDKLLGAFMSGGGVEFSSYGGDCLEAISETNRVLFRRELETWVKAMPRLYETFHSKKEKCGIRICEVGSGVGYSSIELVKIFPYASVVDCIEPDPKSVEKCRKLFGSLPTENGTKLQILQCSLEQAPVRTHFYDLVTMIKCLHDLAYPVDVVKKVREILKPQEGVLMVVDQKVPESLTEMLPNSGNSCEPPRAPVLDPLNFVARWNYSISLFHCLPAVMTQPNSAAIGVVIKESKVRDIGKMAGFSQITVVHETDRLRIYEFRQ